MVAPAGHQLREPDSLSRLCTGHAAAPRQLHPVLQEQVQELVAPAVRVAAHGGHPVREAEFPVITAASSIEVPREVAEEHEGRLIEAAHQEFHVGQSRGITGLRGLCLDVCR